MISVHAPSFIDGTNPGFKIQNPKLIDCLIVLWLFGEMSITLSCQLFNYVKIKVEYDGDRNRKTKAHGSRR
jgi:hypothetical protein